MKVLDISYALANYEGLAGHAQSIKKLEKLNLSKQDLLEFKGKVIDLLPNAMFRVQLEKNGHIVTAHTAGKLRKIESEFYKETA